MKLERWRERTKPLSWPLCINCMHEMPDITVLLLGSQSTLLCCALWFWGCSLQTCLLSFCQCWRTLQAPVCFPPGAHRVQWPTVWTPQWDLAELWELSIKLCQPPSGEISCQPLPKNFSGFLYSLMDPSHPSPFVGVEGSFSSFVTFLIALTQMYE
jgi:hypothetical protein